MRLFIDTSCPFLGASPDGIVVREDGCRGCLEVKCPFAHKDRTIAEAATEPGFYLKPGPGGLQLARNHQYFYQVMGQMGITGLTWCHFVVYTRRGIHVEYIEYDKRIWDVVVEELSKYYLDVLGREHLKRLLAE